MAEGADDRARGGALYLQKNADKWRDFIREPIQRTRAEMRHRGMILPPLPDDLKIDDEGGGGNMTSLRGPAGRLVDHFAGLISASAFFETHPDVPPGGMMSTTYSVPPGSFAERKAYADTLAAMMGGRNPVAERLLPGRRRRPG